LLGRGESVPEGPAAPPPDDAPWPCCASAPLPLWRLPRLMRLLWACRACACSTRSGKQAVTICSSRQPLAAMLITAKTRWEPPPAIGASQLYDHPLVRAACLMQYAAPARPRPVSNIAHGRTIIAPSQTLHGRKLRSPRRGVSPIDSRVDACAIPASLIRGKHASKTPVSRSCGHFWRVQTLI
jgi:hypothetical protein